MKTKVVVAFAAFLALFILAGASLVEASQLKLLCLNEKEKVEFSLCNPSIPDRTCGSEMGCQYCVSEIEPGVYCPGNINSCNSQGLACTSVGGNSTNIDQTPPIINVNSPVNNKVYQGRSVDLIVNVNEKSDIYFKDNLETGNLWKQVCLNCVGYARARSFNEGFNNITFRATDQAGNAAYFTTSFFVDSQAPRIRGVSPKGGYASGEFSIQFEEANPKNMTIYYWGAQGGVKKAPVNLNNCEIGKTSVCNVDVNLNSYNQQTVQYYFELFDIAGSRVVSKTESTSVDISDPVISSFEYSLDKKKANFVFEIEEMSLKSVDYIDYADANPKWKSLCTRLNGDVCQKSLSFKDGAHNVSFRILDMAGNEASAKADFFIDSKVPKISRTEPKKGFGSGDFEIDFTEDNPKNLTLFYGNSETGMRSKKVEISQCSEVRGKYNCLVSVDLKAYDGEEIEYYFELYDIVGNFVVSKVNEIDIDTTIPTFTSLTYIVSGNYATLTIVAQDENFQEVTYQNENDPRPTEKRLCTKLDSSNKCVKKIRLNSGANSVNVIVYDKAGNAAAQGASISI